MVRGILQRLTNEQRKSEKFGRQVNKVVVNVCRRSYYYSDRGLLYFWCALHISTSTRENKLPSLSFSVSSYFFFIDFLMQMYQFCSIEHGTTVQEQLNDASLAPVINKIFGRRVDFDKWLNSHDFITTSFGSKVSLQRLVK